MNNTPMAVLALLALSGLHGCATTPSFSQLVGERFFVTKLDTYPLVIAAVDGSSSTISPKFVEPGVRQLVLQGPSGAAGIPPVLNYTLDVKPCTRYYIVAVKASPLDNNFTPRIDHEMLLSSDCKAAPN
jgi:hypothetical protein